MDGSRVLLIECEALVPRLSLRSIASTDDVNHYANRIADAVEQVRKHIDAIENERSTLSRLSALKHATLVITLGRVEAVNTVFFKPLITTILEHKGVPETSFWVLSLHEFEKLLSLAERGVSLPDLIERIENKGWNEALEEHSEMLRETAIPTLVRRKGMELAEDLDRLAPGSEA